MNTTVKKKEYNSDEFLNALLEFDDDPEVKGLFKKGLKYITDMDVRCTISPEVEAKLKAIEAMIEVVLVSTTGNKHVAHWEKLRHYNGGGHFWVRQNGEDAAVLSLKSISIAFDCMP